MLFRLFKIEVIQGSAEDVSLGGKRRRRETVLLKVGKRSISRRAFEWGIFLAVIQVLDASLTYIGVRLIGIRMEGNSFVSELMRAYGVAPALFLVKIFAVILIMVLTMYAHSRLWICWLMAVLCLIYLSAAVVPWVYIISDFHTH